MKAYIDKKFGKTKKLNKFIFFQTTIRRKTPGYFYHDQVQITSHKTSPNVYKTNRTKQLLYSNNLREKRVG